MAKYSTTTSLQILLVGTTFDTATTSLADRMITQAENEVDKYLSKRYDMGLYLSMSLSALPPLLNTLTDQLAAGYFYQFSARGGKETLAFAQQLIKGSLDNLTLIANREADLLDVNLEPVAESSDGAFRILSTTTQYTPTMNIDNELDWKQDQDQLDDIRSERE